MWSLFAPQWLLVQPLNPDGAGGLSLRIYLLASVHYAPAPGKEAIGWATVVIGLGWDSMEAVCLPRIRLSCPPAGLLDSDLLWQSKVIVLGAFSRIRSSLPSESPGTGLLDSHLSAMIVFGFAAERPCMASINQRPLSRVRRGSRVHMRLSMMCQFSILRYARMTDIFVRQNS